jgi:hypothetical protein
VHFWISLPSTLIALDNKNVKAVTAFYGLPSVQAMLAFIHVVYRKFFAGSCPSTRVAPEPTYSSFINGIGCVPAGVVGAATIPLFSPDNSLSYV